MNADPKRSRSKEPGLAIHLLDVGVEDYGDSVLIEARGNRILIDGGHRSDMLGSSGHPAIPEQLRSILDEPVPRIDLLVATHSHLDHIGCLPELVSANAIQVGWALVADPDLGWGDVVGQDSTPSDDRRVMDAVSGLREEVPTASMSGDIRAWLSDAVTLRSRYRGMITGLSAAGSRVIRHGVDSPAGLLKAFSSIGMEVLGPSRTQLVLCAAGIKEGVSDAVDRSAAILAQDAILDGPGLYRALRTSPFSDAAASRLGPLVNLQSVVLALNVAGTRAFLGGDMQLADPQTRDAGIAAEITALRSSIRERRPFAFAKLGHHGSENAQDAGVMDDLGSPAAIGITLGSGSANHPAPKVLQFLRAEPQATWARTDRNGLSTFVHTARGWDVKPARGQLNDSSSNRPDVVIGGIGQPLRGGSSEAPGAGAQTANVLVTETGAIGRQEPVEVTVRIPPGVDRVRIDIQVDRSGLAGGQTASRMIQSTAGSDPEGRKSLPSASVPDLTVGGGRPLPRLVYVTNSDRLAQNLGIVETQRCLAALNGQPGRVIDLTDPGAVNVTTTESETTQALRADPSLAGVVIVGGYDVVPSHLFDTLPSNFDAIVRREDDPDDFLIWTDDFYGWPGTPDAARPVSRVPDGRAATTLFAALGVGSGSQPKARGVRNVARPFAEAIYKPLPSVAPMEISLPIDATGLGILAADITYLMLHGSDQDGSRFWGEDGVGGYIEAFNVDNIGAAQGMVVLAGACWGALPTDTPARTWQAGMALAPRLPANSIAMRYLSQGATAFVGCTGSHYSPGRNAPTTMGGPMHAAFFEALLGGAAPAQALFEAKRRYLAGMPHGLTNPLLQAYESKTLWQFTCLGLGW